MAKDWLHNAENLIKKIGGKKNLITCLTHISVLLKWTIILKIQNTDYRTQIGNPERLGKGQAKAEIVLKLAQVSKLQNE